MDVCRKDNSAVSEKLDHHNTGYQKTISYYDKKNDRLFVKYSYHVDEIEDDTIEKDIHKFKEALDNLKATLWDLIEPKIVPILKAINNTLRTLLRWMNK